MESTLRTAGFRITKRDVKVLRAHERYGELDSRQVQRLLFNPTEGGVSKVKRRLKHLRDAGLLQRVPQLFVQGLGDRPWVHTLSIDGAHYLGLTKRTRATKRGGFVLEHTRWANSVLIALEAGAKALGWESATEPEAVVRPRLPDGSPIPDGQITIARPPQARKSVYLLEYDRGNEYKAKWLKKLRAYRAGGKNLERILGTDSILVLTVTRGRNPAALDLNSDPAANAARMEDLLDWTREETTSKRYLFTTEDLLLSAPNPWTAPIWRSVKEPAPHSL